MDPCFLSFWPVAGMLGSMGGIPPKTGLGRGLGSLMGNAKRQDMLPRNGGSRAMSNGVGTLLRGARGGEQIEMERLSAASSEPVSRGLLQVTLVLADAMLLVVAAWMVFGNPKPFGWLEALVCAGAVLTGCWLSCLAFWLD